MYKNFTYTRRSTNSSRINVSNKKLLIENNYDFHYEIIESIIVKFRNFFNISSDEHVDIYLSVKPNKEYKKYINSKYPNIKFIKIRNFDYYINCTIYDKDYDNYIDKSSTNKIYIAHHITERLKNLPNVYFITPLSINNFFYADVLPFSDKKCVANIPIYVIQGNLCNERRDYDLLIKLLKEHYNYDFQIKLIGKGSLPESLYDFKDKVTVKNNLNFLDFHKEFTNAYCILPLISINTHPQYYTNKLTSTINYAKGYNLKCLIDTNLQNIYNLENVEVYNDINDITVAFTKTLQYFYDNKSLN